MKTLLVPTDFSEASRYAFQYAIKLARLIDAKIEVAHIYKSEQADLGLTVITTPCVGIEKAVNNDLKTFVNQGKVSKLIKNQINTEGYDYFGEPSDKIVMLSKSSAIDMLLMGTAGEHDAPEKWFGSVASHAAQEAYCPVLLIPNGARFRRPKNILYACNLDEPNSSAMFERLAFIAKCLGSKIHVLHVDTNFSPKQEMTQLVNREWNFVECERFSFKTAIYKNQDVRKAIDIYAANHHIDLVVISTQHRSILKKLFHDSLTKKLAMETSLPLLVLHKEDKFSLF
jgi:nucleotide-binding universal stress UspA family protein